jgi:hypothetical protein
VKQILRDRKLGRSARAASSNGAKAAS